MVTLLPWIILFAPLAAALIIMIFGLRHRTLSAVLAIGSLFLGFLLSAYLAWKGFSHSIHLPVESSVLWLQAGILNVSFGLIVDELSLMMALVVTGVSSAIFLYSAGYMEHDPGYTRYFGCLALFAFSMLGIVFAANWIVLFIFWELVGATSYLLIGFWYQKPSAAEAGKKAFMVNRVADFGFLLGILLTWSLVGLATGTPSFSFATQAAILPEALHHGAVSAHLLSIAAVLLFCGVIGKSAQFPLHVWLPDAMEGPTPVSALIHAATMVAAGIYLLCRAFYLFAEVPNVLHIIAWVGGITAFVAATVAIVQFDIKRVLAYSTVSQLGYMVMAVGLGGYTAGMFHLTTHAFFKALLFLGSGSVIHALHTQDMREMGGLMKKLPITSWTFLIGTLALCGIFPLSGFWSKDEILTLAAARNLPLYVIGSLTAGLTAFYMGRLIFMTFFGQARWKKAPHESPAVMTIPLIFLAVLSVVAGFLGIPKVLHHHHGVHLDFNMRVALVSSLVAVAGLFLSYLYYGKKQLSAKAAAQRFPRLHRLLVNKYFMDELYLWIVKNVQGGIAVLFTLFEERVIIGTMVNGTAALTRWTGDHLRKVQTGQLQTYALIMTGGVTALVYILLLLR
ncbi:MAG: NADH-quinone oxidoreductase subunit L [Candidatus Omnitrophica bacterium]|nr:NADH-quinone oxidoreductase subunit L [Candidatus Omnitrophota bacterium]